MTKLKGFSGQLEEFYLDAVERYSKENNYSMSHFYRQAIKDYMLRSLEADRNYLQLMKVNLAQPGGVPAQQRVFLEKEIKILTSRVVEFEDVYQSLVSELNSELNKEKGDE